MSPASATIALQAEAALELKKRRRDGLTKPKPAIAFEPYGHWCAKARPQFRWDYPHFEVMQANLDAVTTGEFTRVVFTVAIRHGKTEHNTIGYAAYLIERDPTTRILLASYNQKQALKFSRQIRRLVRARGVAISPERDSASEWETVQGGGVRAVGAGEGVASINADFIIIDDPIGKREDAESQAQRDALWAWFTNDILARTEPHTRVILTCSRWHNDDLIGRTLDRHEDRWVHIDLPGVAEYGPNDPLDILDRKEGELLWPELRDEAWMDEKRVELGSYGFASQMQLRPRPREGGMFKWEWWGYLDDVPKSGPMVRYWDTAGTDVKEGNNPDYTSGSLLCRMEDKRTAIVDIERFRHSVARRDARMREVCKEDIKKYGRRVVWWIEKESGIAGDERITELVRSLQNLGMAVYSERPTGSKRNRAEPFASKAEAGNVLLCPGEWRDSFRLEAANFTGNDKGHDDQVDSTAGADAKLAVSRAEISSYSIAI